MSGTRAHTAAAGPSKNTDEAPREVVPFNQRPGIEDNSTWWSFILMAHLSELFAKGSAKDLYAEDLGGVSEEDRTEVLYQRFCVNFEAQKKLPKEKRSLWSVLFSSTGLLKLNLAFILFGISSALQFGPVLILTHLVRYFSDMETLSSAGLWSMVALLFVCPMLSSVTAAHSNRIMAHIGCQVRNIVITTLYRKALTISASRRQAISTGRILTMFSGDTNQIRLFLYFVNNFVVAPFQLAAALYLIYQQVSVATFVGLGYQVVIIPVQIGVMRVVAKLRASKMRFTDRRVKLLNEVLNGIRIIKYYAWEGAFIKKITSIRYDEVRLLKIIGYSLQGSFGIMMLGAPQIMSVLIFWTYTSLGHQLDAAKVFTTMALFGLMSTPFLMIPYGMQLYNTASVSANRIMDFLCEDDMTVYVTNDVSDPDSVAIEFVDASLSWLDEEEAAALATSDKKKKEAKASTDTATTGKNGAGYEKVPTKNDEKSVELVATKRDENKNNNDGLQQPTPVEGLNRSVHTLQNINVCIKRGQLVGIIGPVGSGKSSFLAAVLGEMHLRSGHVRVAESCTKSIAFCDQRAWIVNASVRDNVLFGSDFDEAKFDRALHAAAMIDDLKVLPDGLDTEIGERGINLSGGQKARVSLARAIYNNAEMYLLDDPLSAVDAHVGEHIFQRCLVEELAGKTRLLVTHHSHVLPRCDYVIILDIEGRVKAAGSYGEIISSGVDIAQFVAAASHQEQKKKPAQKEEEGKSSGRSRTRTASSGGGAAGGAGKRSNASTPRDRSAPSTPRDNDDNSSHHDNHADKSEADAVSAAAAVETTQPVPEGVSEGAVLLNEQQNEGEDNDNGDDLDDEESEERSPSSPAAAAEKQKPKGLIVSEERATGKLSMTIVKEYIFYGGIIVFVTTLILQLMSQALNIEANFWLSDWGKEQTLNSVNGVEMSHHRLRRWMNGFAGLQIASVGLMGTARLILMHWRTNASYQMHEVLLRRVLYFPVSFFDVTPIGRVINRFSQDMATLDEDLPQSINQLIGYGGGVLGAIGGIIGATKGTFLILFFPLIYLYSRFQAYFASSNTSIARVEAISRSPIYADFSQTLSGTNTIRAYGQQGRFIAGIEDLANQNTVPGVLQQIAVQWLSIRLDFVGAVIMLFLGVLSAALQDENFIPAGYLGLSLSYAITMTGLLKLSVRGLTQVEAQFNSVDRVSHYIHNIPMEHVYDGEYKHNQDRPHDEDTTARVVVNKQKDIGQQQQQEKKKGDIDWPTDGVVEFQNVSMGYRGGDLVLKDVSFKVNSKDKVGIAGRTGFVTLSLVCG
jgi:ABC-type multidrug transport system fused ATPase/permease subunit